jgi:hypothetical protein
MTEVVKKSNKFLTALSIIFIIAGLVTLLPYKNIDDDCFLGYKALCAFTPISTVILFIVGAFFWFFRKREVK